MKQSEFDKGWARLKSGFPRASAEAKSGLEDLLTEGNVKGEDFIRIAGKLAKAAGVGDDLPPPYEILRRILATTLKAPNRNCPICHGTGDLLAAEVVLHFATGAPTPYLMGRDGLENGPAEGWPQGVVSWSVGGTLTAGPCPCRGSEWWNKNVVGSPLRQAAGVDVMKARKMLAGMYEGVA